MKIIIANWKMQLNARESIALTRQIVAGITPNAELVLCPSFTVIAPVQELLIGSSIKAGGQDVFWETHGAYTGEISAKQLRELGCSYVIVGHSERRRDLHESDATINKKLISSLSGKLTPILCVGESYRTQLKGALKDLHLRHQEKIIIAFESEWAIGKKVAKLDVVERAHREIRKLTSSLLVGLKPKQLRVIYGGGLDAKSASAFIGNQEVDGLLVGGASLTWSSFKRILQAV
ncbi:MAG: triose-phosphate isomerase [Patescibacteria group bacterium]